jgi:hypothetical protein
MSSGALKPDAMMEMIGRSSEGIPKFKNKFINSFVEGKFMYGVGKLDRAMRVHAFTVGEQIFNDFKSGDKSAAKLISDLRLDPKKVSSAEVGRTLSDVTQFKTGPGEIPLWASSEYGKAVFQYSNFAYRYTIFAGEVLRDALKGNVKPLSKLLAMGAITGEVVNDIRSFVKGQPLSPKEKDTPWNDKKWEENLLAATKNRRIPWSHPEMRMLQNLATIGGAGVLQTMVERAMRMSQQPTAESIVSGIAGPVAGNVTGLTEKTAKQGAKGAAKWGLEQIPGYGYDIAREVFPPKKKSWRSR